MDYQCQQSHFYVLSTVWLNHMLSEYLQDNKMSKDTYVSQDSMIHLFAINELQFVDLGATK